MTLLVLHFIVHILIAITLTYRQHKCQRTINGHVHFIVRDIIRRSDLNAIIGPCTANSADRPSEELQNPMLVMM